MSGSHSFGFFFASVFYHALVDGSSNPFPASLSCFFLPRYEITFRCRPHTVAPNIRYPGGYFDSPCPPALESFFKPNQDIVSVSPQLFRWTLTSLLQDLFPSNAPPVAFFQEVESLSIFSWRCFFFTPPSKLCAIFLLAGYA